MLHMLQLLRLLRPIRVLRLPQDESIKGACYFNLRVSQGGGKVFWLLMDEKRISIIVVLLCCVVSPRAITFGIVPVEGGFLQDS